MKPRQQRDLAVPMQMKFRPLVKQAWQRMAFLKNWNMQDKKAERRWYEQQLWEIIGCTSTTDMVITPRHFDDMLMHFATLADNQAEIDRMAYASERRVRWLIARCLAELTYLENREVPCEYAAATYTHMKFPLPLEECPAEHLLPVFKALDTHVRNLAAEHGITRAKLRAAVKHMAALEAAYG